MTKSERGQIVQSVETDLIQDKIWLKILIGLVLGVGLGLALSPQGGNLLPENYIAPVTEWVALPGVIFLALLQMIVIPLIVFSIVTGLADSGSLEFVKRIGWRAVGYFILTSAIAVTIGIAIALFIQPGANIDQTLVSKSLAQNSSLPHAATMEAVADLTIPQRIANLIPTNWTQASLDKNMLQIVVGAILIGLALIGLPKKTAQPVLDLCVSGQAVTMRMIGWAMALAPYAVFGLIASVVTKLGAQAITSVGLYMICVLAGLFAMLVIYLLIVMLVGKMSPLTFLKGVREAQIIAFSTSSSGATMPVSIACAEEHLKLQKPVVRFVIPLGATINMDGTALYQAAAAVFLTQVFGIELTLTQLVLLMVTTVGASIGTPAIPSVGIVVLASILLGIGVPPEGIALILGVDRILDMCRTTINVTGDLTASTVMNKLVRA
ncbi:MAG: dicarboxylate/amino acid:cation symporter [Pseudobdellovibrionaceae bacterium]